MGKIQSDLGESSFDSPNELRKFTVDDPTQDLPPFDPRQMTTEEIMAARQQKLRSMNAVSDTARRRIEHLVGIGRSYVDVDIDDSQGGTTTFTLRTLKSKEMRRLAHVAQEANKVSAPDTVYQIRCAALSYGISAIDGVDFDVVLGCQGQGADQRLAAREAFVDELEEHVLNYIYAKYNQLVRDTSTKYSVTTPEEAKEVAVDLKKSS